MCHCYCQQEQLPTTRQSSYQNDELQPASPAVKTIKTGTDNWSSCLQLINLLLRILSCRQLPQLSGVSCQNWCCQLDLLPATNQPSNQNDGLQAAALTLHMQLSKVLLLLPAGATACNSSIEHNYELQVASTVVKAIKTDTDNWSRCLQLIIFLNRMMSCRQLPQLSKLTKLLQFLKFVPSEDHSFPSFEESFPSTSNENFLKTQGGIDQTSDFQTVLIRGSRKGFHKMHRARIDF
jgi:hypothetical protein